MYWGLFGLFHTATSHWNWYKTICMRDSSCTLIRIKFTFMFSMYLESGDHRYFRWKFITVLTQNPIVYMSAYQWWPQTLVAICRNMAICDVFRPGRFIRVLSYYQQYIHRSHHTVCRNVTLYTLVFKNQSCLVKPKPCFILLCLDLAFVAKIKLEPFVLSFQLGLRRLEYLFPILGEIHYACITHAC